MSEKLKAEDVVKTLNNYFSDMIDIVFKYNGTLDKIIGDELMVLFGILMVSLTHWMSLYQKVYHSVMKKTSLDMKKILDMMKKTFMGTKKCLWMVQ